MAKKLFLAFLMAGAISMLTMSFHYFLNETSGILDRKSVASTLWFRVVFKAHILFGILAIFIGPIQFLPSLRRNFRGFHKKLGYSYALSILLSSGAGLIIAQFAMGGWVTQTGFSILSFLWAYCTVMAVISAIKADLGSHRTFMIVSYALTFAAVTQRTLLLLPLLTDVPFYPVYRVSAWLPWMLNLVMAKLIINRQKLQPK